MVKRVTKDALSVYGHKKDMNVSILLFVKDLICGCKSEEMPGHMRNSSLNGLLVCLWFPQKADLFPPEANFC